MPSMAPNLLNNLTGSSDPFCGLLIVGPLVLFGFCVCVLTTEDDDDDDDDCLEVDGVGCDLEVGVEDDGACDDEGAEIVEEVGNVVCEPIVVVLVVAGLSFNKTGLFDFSGQVYSVCVETDTDCVGLTFAAYVVGFDEASNICLASANETFFSCLRRVISRCRCHSVQLCEYAA